MASSWEHSLVISVYFSSGHSKQSNHTAILGLDILYHIYWLILLLLVPDYQPIKPDEEYFPSSRNYTGHKVRIKLILMSE